MNGARRIYIRHADKEYTNGKSDIYKHDPGITSKGVEKAKLVASHLIEQWGRPERIIVSPYRRTRETAQIMNSVLDTPVPIHVDIELSEYLGNHKLVPIDVTEGTLIYDPPHPENMTDLNLRIKSHQQKVIKYSQNNQDSIIWIVTHGIIIKEIASLMKINIINDFPTLTCLSITIGEKITKGELIIFNDTSDINTSNSFNNIFSNDKKIKIPYL